MCLVKRIEVRDTETLWPEEGHFIRADENLLLLVMLNIPLKVEIKQLNLFESC